MPKLYEVTVSYTTEIVAETDEEALHRARRDSFEVGSDASFDAIVIEEDYKFQPGPIQPLGESRISRRTET